MTSDAHILTTPSRSDAAQTAATALQQLVAGQPAGRGHGLRPTRTGFALLDRVLDGGIRVHDLLLLGGMPGVGKTIAALQMARDVALQDRTAVYVCYEHDDSVLLGRLLCLELGELATPQTAPEIDLLRSAVLETTAGLRDLATVLHAEPLVAAAYDRVTRYADRLWLLRGSGTHTGLAELEQVIERHAGRGGVLFVDYLQKVSVRPEPPTEAEKVTHIAEGLKELALAHELAIVAVVAADKEGIKAPRLRLHHLRGSSALAYECDVAVILNDKHQTVAKVHLTYDPVRAETFKHQVVFTLEKNRGGPAPVDLEFRKDFANYRFDPQGAYCQERLVDERIQSE